MVRSIFLHNEVRSIEQVERRLEQLVPEARIRIAHGQMLESKLEVVMRDFQQQRFNLLLCSSIIESGIDIPNANTIIINRADRLGLAQLHQVRGRVGRSNRQAYAYLLIPAEASITDNARKRLEAIASLEGLGAGFALASHDLEIRGAGELLGEEQSGSIDDIGFSLYTDYLQRAIRDLTTNSAMDTSQTVHDPERIDIELDLPILFPDSYLPDVHERLILYKKIAAAQSREELYELQLETIDRFGLLPPPAKAVFSVSEIKLMASVIGIKKVMMGNKSGHLVFVKNTPLDPIRLVELIESSDGQIWMKSGYELSIAATLQSAEEIIHFVKNIMSTLECQ